MVLQLIIIINFNVIIYIHAPNLFLQNVNNATVYTNIIKYYS